MLAKVRLECPKKHMLKKNDWFIYLVSESHNVRSTSAKVPLTQANSS